MVNTMTRYSRRETQNSENLLCSEVSVGFLFVIDISPRLTILITNINISVLHLYSTQVQQPHLPSLILVCALTIIITAVRGRDYKKNYRLAIVFIRVFILK